MSQELRVDFQLLLYVCDLMTFVYIKGNERTFLWIMTISD